MIEHMFEDLLDAPPDPLEDVPVEQVLADYARIVDALDAGAPVDALLPPWESEPEPAPWSACAPSGWLALELDQGTAVPAALSDADLIEGIVAFDRLVMAQTLVADLPGTLAAWEAGTLDVLKVRAITETSYVLTPEQRGALEARVLPHAGTQTRSQLRAALTRAVLAIDPDGAAARHQQRRKDRRTSEPAMSD